MPGLVRGMARTAAVVGTATATRHAVSRRQASKDAAAYSQAAAQVQPQQAAPPQEYYEAPVEYDEAPAQEADQIEQLERLGALYSQGLLTDEEFAASKAKLLGT